MELIQMPSSRPDYHDLHLKSTTAMKIFTLTLSGSKVLCASGIHTNLGRTQMAIFLKFKFL
jgi:hypothetical protein